MSVNRRHKWIYRNGYMVCRCGVRYRKGMTYKVYEHPTKGNSFKAGNCEAKEKECSKN